MWVEEGDRNRGEEYRGDEESGALARLGFLGQDADRRYATPPLVMKIGKSYKLTEFLAWTRRRIYVLLVMAVIPVVVYELFDQRWIAAPWSVAQQGNTNVSHGCINMSTERAAWFFNFSQPGDVVEIRNSSAGDLRSDIYDWVIPWEEWQAGSALK